MAQYKLCGRKLLWLENLDGSKQSLSIKAAGKDKSLSLETVMMAVRESKEDLSKQIDAKTTNIQNTLLKIETSLSTLSEQVEEMEGRIAANEDIVSDALKRLNKSEKELRYVKDKLDDLEDRSRRNNIRIFNILEKSEGWDATGFLQRIIPQILHPITFDTLVVIKRCHRVGKPTDKTRSLIARFFNFKNKEKVLRRAREMKEIFLENRRIYIYADCSAETQRKKDAFKPVKKMLRGEGLRVQSAPSSQASHLSRGSRQVVYFTCWGYGLAAPTGEIDVDVLSLHLLDNFLEIQATGLVLYLMEQLSKSLPSSDLI